MSLYLHTRHGLMLQVTPWPASMQVRHVQLRAIQTPARKLPYITYIAPAALACCPEIQRAPVRAAHGQVRLA